MDACHVPTGYVASSTSNYMSTTFMLIYKLSVGLSLISISIYTPNTFMFVSNYVPLNLSVAPVSMMTADFNMSFSGF
jgi:hypothetical protein